MLPKFKFIASCLFLLAFNSSFGQQNTRSPYSLFGVGVLHYDGFADHISNGRNGNSLHHTNNYSLSNPASLGAVKFSTFNAGVYMDMGKLKTSQTSQTFSNAGFNYIALAMPLKKLKGAMAFGLLPFSDVGYSITNNKDSAGVLIRNEFVGNGGLSKFNFAFGSEIFKFLSVGANYSYVFGQLNEIQGRRYPGNRFMTSSEDYSNLFLKGHRFDLGLQLHTTTKTGKIHVLGVSMTTGSKLKGEQDRLVRTFTEVADGVEITRDTLINTVGVSSQLTLPNSFKFSYTYGKGDIWQASVGSSITMWQNYKDIYGGNANLSDEQTLSLGFFYCKNTHFDNAIKTNKAATYLKSIKYSAGFYHSNGYITAFNTKIAESSVSLGFGFPFTRKYKDPEGTTTLFTSRLYLTGEYIRRGTISNNLIQEDFFKLTLGLNLTDKWFNPRKFY